MASLITETPSPITGEKILAALSYGSVNRKTGNVDTLWILHADTPPHEAVTNGQDASICGNCPHRRKHGTTKDCYVLPHQAALSVWNSLKNPQPYRPMSRVLRLGGYGDPAMIPEKTIEALMGDYDATLGYTQQWEEPWAQVANLYCMASVLSIKGKKKANKKGWRTFRTSYKKGITDLQPDEVICPAVTHPGITCEACRLCQGNNRHSKNIVVEAHGTNSKALIKL